MFIERDVCEFDFVGVFLRLYMQQHPAFMAACTIRSVQSSFILSMRHENILDAHYGTGADDIQTGSF